MCFNSNIMIKDWPDWNIFIKYSNLIFKQINRSYPYYLACFIN